MASKPLLGAWRALRDYAVGLLREGSRDHIPFLASAITFNAILAAVPFLLVVVSLVSLSLERAAGANGVDPMAQLQQTVGMFVPVLPREGVVADLLRGVVDRGRALGLIGLILFVAFSARLFGSLRTALAKILDLTGKRGVLAGMLFDLRMVIVSSLFFVLNIGVTVALSVGRARGLDFLGLSRGQIGALDAVYGFLTAWLFIFIMFLLIYRFVPARRLPWGSAALAAAFAAVGWEILKAGFSLYLTHFADFGSVYGNLATVVVVVLWVYYSSTVFLLGAEIAHVHELRRLERRGTQAPA
ncbi:MAG: YihY/virulence factor BrkB family protein [Gemmatimonadetes bacterium]|nr:YihY/virulence factor BrkB family protein [Gemmatimonadota bacterium]